MTVQPDPQPAHPDTAEGRPKPARLSDVLRDLVGDETRERIMLADFLNYLGARAFGPLLVVFALPNLFPTPPGTSAILGFPLLFLTFQMVVGAKPWFPAFLAKRSLARLDFARIITPVLPRLQRVERLLQPRLAIFSTRAGERMLGLVCLALAVLLVLPIPLGNMGPSLAIVLIGMGLIERDGVWIGLGLLTACAAVFLVYGIIWAMVQSAIHLFTAMFA